MSIKVQLDDQTAKQDAGKPQYTLVPPAIAALEEQERYRWRPVMDGDGEMPEVDEDGFSDYILVNFSNAPGMFDIAQYRVDEAGGAFYSGDSAEPYTAVGVFVSAWRPLPKAYREDGA
mgnify:CR=1 FL=1